MQLHWSLFVHMFCVIFLQLNDLDLSLRSQLFTVSVFTDGGRGCFQENGGTRLDVTKLDTFHLSTKSVFGSECLVSRHVGQSDFTVKYIFN